MTVALMTYLIKIGVLFVFVDPVRRDEPVRHQGLRGHGGGLHHRMDGCRGVGLRRHQGAASIRRAADECPRALLAPAWVVPFGRWTAVDAA
jgi:hypothetical protein